MVIPEPCVFIASLHSCQNVEQGDIDSLGSHEAAILSDVG